MASHYGREFPDSDEDTIYKEINALWMLCREGLDGDTRRRWLYTKLMNIYESIDKSRSRELDLADKLYYQVIPRSEFYLNKSTHPDTIRFYNQDRRVTLNITNPAPPVEARLSDRMAARYGVIRDDWLNQNNDYPLPPPRRPRRRRSSPPPSHARRPRRRSSSF